MWLQKYDSDFVVAGDGVLMLYQGSKSPTTITIPFNVKRIPEHVFGEVTKSLKNVIIPSNVQFIAKEAFAIITQSSDSTGSTSLRYSMRYFNIIGVKNSYAYYYSKHAYYTFEQLK